MKKYGKIAANVLMFGIVFMAMMTLGAHPLFGTSFAIAPPISFGDLNFDSGQDNMPGTQLLAYYCPIEDIDTLPEYMAAPADMGDYVTVDQAIVCKTGKMFLPLYASPESGKIDDNLIEGKDNNSFTSVYEFFFPKGDKKALGFQRMAPTGKFIVIVLEADGAQRLMGVKPGVPATLKSIAGSTGQSSGGDKGATFQFQSIQNGPCPIYEGEIPLVAAV